MLVRDAGRADPGNAHEDLEQVVEPCAGEVLDRRRAHREVNAAERHAPEVAVVLGARKVEVGHVPPVVDDALRVRLGEPDACEGRVLERRLTVGDVAELDHAAILASAPFGAWHQVPATRCRPPSARHA